MNKKIFNLIKSNFGIFFFGLLLLILFRDFLYTYRIQLEKFLPYYNYQDQIMYYLTGDSKYDVQAPMSLRFLGLWIQFLIYKFIPCLELSNTNIIFPYPEYSCVTFSSALMNYISLCGIMSVIFSYCYKKLNFRLSESILSVLFAYIYINHVEAFTLDRISILYFLIILYYLDNKYLSLLLILCASLVNEKIIFVLGVLFFIRLFLNQKKEYLRLFITTFVSGLIVIGIFIFYSQFLGYGYLQSDMSGQGIYDTALTKGLDRIISIFTSKSGLSNGALPLLFAISPYIISFYIKDSKFYFSKIDIIIPISLLIFTAGGGTEQTGRYVMYSMPLWIPIFSQQLLYFFSDKKINNS